MFQYILGFMIVDKKQQEEIFYTERWQQYSKFEQFYFLFTRNIYVSIISKDTYFSMFSKE
jgi:hypothetical protein